MVIMSHQKNSNAGDMRFSSGIVSNNYMCIFNSFLWLNKPKCVYVMVGTTKKNIGFLTKLAYFMFKHSRASQWNILQTLYNVNQQIEKEHKLNWLLLKVPLCKITSLLMSYCGNYVFRVLCCCLILRYFREISWC